MSEVKYRIGRSATLSSKIEVFYKTNVFIFYWVAWVIANILFNKKWFLWRSVIDNTYFSCDSIKGKIDGNSSI